MRAERDLAECLMAAARDGRLNAEPTWHIPWLYHWRAAHLGPEAEAADRARAIEAGHPWAEAFWDAEGRLRPLEALDREMLRLHRADWRAEQGLPDGAGEGWP